MLLNYTPHKLNVRRSDGVEVIIISSGLARVASSRKLVDTIDGIGIYETTFGEVTGLPEPQEGTLFITSLIVKQAAKEAGRDDVLSPGDLLRDETGQPKGCDGLNR